MNLIFITVVSSIAFLAVTFSASSGASINTRIFFRVFVPARAMSFPMIEPSETRRSSIIFGLSNCFQMIRINTQAVFAKMINVESLGNFSFFQFVRITMGPSGRYPREFKFTIPITDSTHPLPAFMKWDKLDSFKELLSGCFHGGAFNTKDNDALS